jgi:exodeoxyribonuclease-5
MISDFLSDKIKTCFPFTPTDEQDVLIKELSSFIMSRNNHEVFLLKGFAGTGKTSVISALVKAYVALEQKFVLLAPTGRAAKVFTSYSGQSAFTIHKKIYRQKSMASEGSSFSLADNLHKHTLFIVDEASMIANYSPEGSAFGTGCLLDDLIHYVYSGDGCRLLLVGDTAQLPPVMQQMSPALERLKLESYGLTVYEFMLVEVLRQAQESGILFNATFLRKQIEEQHTNKFPKFRLSGFKDVQKVSGEDLIEKIDAAYQTVGIEDSIVITRSNKRSNIYSKGIRNRVLYKEDEISTGDLLMIVKNNYFWSTDYKEIDFIANGDIVEIVRVNKHYDLYGFRFVDLTLRFLDYDLELDARIVLDTLEADSPSAVSELNKKLFAMVSEDYMHIGNARERMKEMRKDPFLNALQVKFAYAVTCHKAQGGQWKYVFIDQGQISEEQLGIDYFRWLYTAFTRASDKVFLVNFSDDYFYVK